MKTVIDIKQLSFSYGAKKIIRQLDLKISRGQFVALLGPNGAGKSTLLNLLSGVLPYTDGDIAVLDQSLHQISPQKRAALISIVPQETSSNFNFSNFDIVLMGRYGRKRNFYFDSEEEIGQALKAMQLTQTEHLAGRSFLEISGGEKQRVIIAQVLYQDTPILLLDEPTANLDINFQIEIMQMIDKLKKKKKLTVIGVFHDMNLALQYADRVILLKEGTVFQDGLPEDVINGKNIHQVYEAHVIVEKNPFTNKIYITPHHSKHLSLAESKDFKKKKIHIIAGGGSGAYLFNILSSDGHQLTTCILSSVDTDSKIARQLGMALVEGEPFVQISPENKRKNLDLVKNSDVIIVCRVAIGEGNLFNLYLVEEALKLKKEVFFIDGKNFKKRDFTGGKATRFYHKMIQSGAETIESEEKLAFLLRQDI